MPDDLLTSRNDGPDIILYWDVREFLREGGASRLKECAACQQYFVQVTARVTRFCSQPCRLKANPTRKANNATYQHRHREARRRRDLRRIDDAKKQYRATWGAAPTVSDLLKALDMSRHRWNALCQWEEQTHGQQRVTHLH